MFAKQKIKKKMTIRKKDPCSYNYLKDGKSFIWNWPTKKSVNITRNAKTVYDLVICHPIETFFFFCISVIEQIKPTLHRAVFFCFITKTHFLYLIYSSCGLHPVVTHYYSRIAVYSKLSIIFF